MRVMLVPFIVLGLLLSRAAAVETQPLNIVVLFADDWRHDTLAFSLLAAAKIAAPAQMQGRNIEALYLADQQPVWRTEYFYEHAVVRDVDFIPASEALVRKDWKYIY